MQKFIFIICDGLADRPIPELGYKTPLEAAHTPNLDKIAQDGISGMVHTVDIGVRPGSDTAHLSLFGYDPYSSYTGRGPFECSGIGMEIKKGDICFRANAAYVDKNGLVVDRRAGRLRSTKSLIEEVGKMEIDGAEILLQESLGHRIGMIVRGDGLSPNVTDQDPHANGRKVLTVMPKDNTQQAKRTADILNAFTKLCQERLSGIQVTTGTPLSANIILFRGAGALPKNLIPFYDKYHLKACMVSGAPLYKGVAKIVGMDVAEFEPEDGVTGLPDTNIEAKIKKAQGLLANSGTSQTPSYDCVFVHIKAADSLAEDGNFQGKKKFIEKIDAAMKLLAQSSEFLVLITADHTTSCQLRQHTADPVPVVIKGEGVRTDDINAFSERECMKGRLGHLRGQNLMPILIDLMGLAELYGA